MVPGLDVRIEFMTKCTQVLEPYAWMTPRGSFVVAVWTDPKNESLSEWLVDVNQKHIALAFWTVHLISPPFLFFLNGETGERCEDLYTEGAASDGGERRPSMRHDGRAWVRRDGVSLM